MTVETRLKGDAMLAKIESMVVDVLGTPIVPTATEKVLACGYVRENGKPDYVAFYEALIEAKGLNEPTEDPEMTEEEAELRDRYGDDAVDAFIELFSIEDLEHFEDAYQGCHKSGAQFAEELVSDCYGFFNHIPSFVEIDWEATWGNLRCDYTEEDGYIFRTTW